MWIAIVERSEDYTPNKKNGFQMGLELELALVFMTTYLADVEVSYIYGEGMTWIQHLDLFQIGRRLSSQWNFDING